MGYKILFLCTQNSARSQMAEAIMKNHNNPNFEIYSAGSNPGEAVHRMALKKLEHEKIETEGMKPKSLELFIGEDFDFIITLCDRMKEECPVFPGTPLFAHWGVKDPAEVEGSEEEIEKAFSEAYRIISIRINHFLNLPIEKLEKAALQLKMDAIGELTQ